MNKSELIDAVASESGISKSQAGKVLNSFVDTVTKALKDGNTVALTGFGSFQTKARPARSGRNPQTGAAIQIAAATIPSFKAGKSLKDACNS